MLAVVRAPRMPKTEPACFSIQGNVPEYVMKYLRSKFNDVQVFEPESCFTENDSAEDDEELIRWEDSGLEEKFQSMTTPGESLKLLRANFKMTQRQLAEKVGIAVQAISAMERGRAPIGRKMAHKLADALGTSYKNLFW